MKRFLRFHIFFGAFCIAFIFFPTVTTASPAPINQITAEIYQVWGQNGLIGVAIATCESQLRQFDRPHHVIRGKVNSADAGLFQINVEYQAAALSSTSINIYTTRGNILFAKELFDQYGTQPWSASEKCWKPIIAMN